nr:MAG TPA: hypothetical protein [Caudoviricetes sp.]
MTKTNAYSIMLIVDSKEEAGMTIISTVPVKTQH